MSVVFRLAEDGDIDAMAAIRAREWETETYWKRRIGSCMAAELSPQQALPGRAVFVAADDDQVVCDGELEWINVAPEQRGRGIAGQLLVVMAAWFAGQGALRVCVDVEPKNKVARALYARYGAEPLNDHWMVREDIRKIRGN